MSAHTSIEWTDRTWNPVRGCSRVSEGCRNCYAERMAARFTKPGQWGEGFATSRRERLTGRLVPGTQEAERRVDVGARWTGKVALIPAALDEPLRWRKPLRVFVNSMSDLFHESLPDEAIDQVFVVMAATFQRTRHTFQILTKRPERMRAYMATPDRLERIYCAWRGTVDWGSVEAEAWPLPNVWLGTSVEDQATADERIKVLLQTPAAVRFISLEPQLAHVDVAPWVKFARFEERYRELAAQAGGEDRLPKHLRWNGVRPPALDWVIVGGESGPGARPFNAAWARSVVAQCKAAGVPIFVKQLGANVHDRNDAGFLGESPTDWPEEIDQEDRVEDLDRGDYQGAPVRIHLKNRKGGDMAEWPEDLRVREFPKGAA